MTNLPSPLPVADAADDDAPVSRYHVGDRLPAVCELKHVAAVLGLKAPRVFTLYQSGELDFALLTPTVGNKPRFSGKKLQAWIDREPLEESPPRRPHFGRR